MAIAPYVPFNTICVAAPVVGQPMMIVAPANFAQLNAFDLLTENQPVDFVKWTTHVISSSQQEIRPIKFQLLGYGAILQGAVTLIVDKVLTYTTNIRPLLSEKPYVIAEQLRMDDSYFGYELALEFVLSGVGIDIHNCVFDYGNKE